MIFYLELFHLAFYAVYDISALQTTHNFLFYSTEYVFHLMMTMRQPKYVMNE
jgi:hypothetical protein